MTEYCKWASGCLSFHQQNVRFCTTLNPGPILSDYTEEPDKIADIITERRQQYLERLNSGIIYKDCQNCIYKNDGVSNNAGKISRLYLFYWYHCNCGCFYCSYTDETKGEFSDEVKSGNPLVPIIINKLYEKDLIDKENFQVSWGGGEITMLQEFPQLTEYFLDNNVRHISCDSSGIKYSDTISKILMNDCGTITVAVCAGSPETYSKIKKRDKYYQVTDNLKEYVKSAVNPMSVVSKYIILNGFNNNKQEIEKWLKECQRIGVKNTEISMEFCWGQQTKAGKPIEDYNYELFDYAEQFSKELGIHCFRNFTSRDLMERGYY